LNCRLPHANQNRHPEKSHAQAVARLFLEYAREVAKPMLKPTQRALESIIDAATSNRAIRTPR